MTVSQGKLTRSDRPALAWRQTAGDGPTIVFLPGYASDMAGSKATALFAWARANGRNCLLFDYAGCGESEGRFEDETLETWRDDALAVIDERVPTGPLVLIGSSMGGWLMLLVALALKHVDWRIEAMIGIAAAPDFTDWGYSEEQKAMLARDSRLLEDNPYGPEPTLTTLAFWHSGQRNLVLGGPILLACPVRLLHGQSDGDVPASVSLRLAERLASSDVQTILVKHGDHRLSGHDELGLLIMTVSNLLRWKYTP